MRPVPNDIVSTLIRCLPQILENVQIDSGNTRLINAVRLTKRIIPRLQKSNAMLIVKQDKTRKEEEGQIFVELTIYRDVRNIADCNRSILVRQSASVALHHGMREMFYARRIKNILKMNGNNIYIEKNNLLDAYKKGNADNKKMLENLFGKEMFRPKNIMERIKTFDDAFKELGENHPLVKEYHKRHLFLEDDSDISSDLVAYLKLRIITAALNEG